MRLAEALALHAQVAAWGDLRGAARREVPWEVWPDHHELVRTGRELFAALAGEPLVEHCTGSPPWRMYGFGADEVWLTADGRHGMVVALHCFGALAGGIDEHLHWLLPDGTRLHVQVGTDTSQALLPIEAAGPDPAAVERALEAAAVALEGLREEARAEGGAG